MLEQDLQQLTAAVKELTAAIKRPTDLMDQMSLTDLSDILREVVAVRKDLDKTQVVGDIIDQEPVSEPAKTEPAPEPEPAPVKAEAPQAEPVKEAAKPEPKAEEPAPESDVPSEDELKAMLKELFSVKGADAVSETIGAFGASRLSSIPEEKRAALKAAIEEALA